MCVCANVKNDSKMPGESGRLHELGKFFLHFLLDVGVVLHLGEQRFGGAEISW